jgi:hypothetical protein
LVDLGGYALQFRDALVLAEALETLGDGGAQRVLTFDVGKVFG